jgi:hypothetical protein
MTKTNKASISFLLKISLIFGGHNGKSPDGWVKQTGKTTSL